MVFTSFEFLIFIILFVCIWKYVKGKGQIQHIVMVIASLIFYGWWDYRFLPMIIVSGLIDYWAGWKMQHTTQSSKRKTYLILSLLGNLGALGFFKYSGFFLKIIHDIQTTLGLELLQHNTEWSIILPLGISFYTFQSMSYSIDIYRNRLEAEKNIWKFFAFLIMFPQLVAGPIIRAKDILSQLDAPKALTDVRLWHSIRLIVYGYFLKVFIADNIGYLINPAWEYTLHQGDTIYWWLCAIGFSLQIYCDFNGYTLMAKGIAHYLGFRFKMNFNHPYLATSIQDFWRRWHISLSTWFRDYVYIPLGGSRTSKPKAYWNMFLTMVVSGIWHGANYTFIAWGALHGLALAIERNIPILRRIPIIGRTWTLIIAIVGWVFFRAKGMQNALDILSWMFYDIHISLQEVRVIYVAPILIAMFVSAEVYYYLNRKTIHRPTIWNAISLAFIAAIAFLYRGPQLDFIYFQF